MNRKPPLSVAMVLRWADAHHARTGEWPNVHTGRVKETPDNTWQGISSALRAGIRGLPRCSGLPEFLEEHRGVRNPRHLPPLSVTQILKWADAYHQRTGEWPRQGSGPIPEAPGETWNGVFLAMQRRRRGLTLSLTLAQLLAANRGKRNPRELPRLTHKQVLAWAEAHHRRTARWPQLTSGPVCEQPDTTWLAINSALVRGGRGLPGGTTLATLLTAYQAGHLNAAQGKTRRLQAVRRRRLRRPRLTVREILAWADDHRERTARWPNRDSGSIAAADDEDWGRIESALNIGTRGLPGRSSLARLLAQYRGVRNRHGLSRLTLRQILDWADAYRRRHKQWPRRPSGPVNGVPGETWERIDYALRVGSRGLPSGYTLARLLTRRRGARNHWHLPRLSIAQILEWADRHRRRTGRWPFMTDGTVTDAPGESWHAINTALYQGVRGLPGGDSLPQLLARRRSGGKQSTKPGSKH